MNRVSTITDSAYSLNFNYDPYGNMSVSQNTGVNLSPVTPVNTNGSPFNGVSNQLNSAGYDAAGNQISFASGAYTIQYDAENHQTQLYDTGTQTEVVYVYDGSGQRVAKITGDNSRTIYIYDALGQLALEYRSSSVDWSDRPRH